MINPVGPSAVSHQPESRNEQLWKLSQSLESSFLSEMLKAAGFGKTRDAFGGGAGEEHFSSHLVNLHSEQLTKVGGIGLAESIYDSLVRQTGKDS